MSKNYYVETKGVIYNNAQKNYLVVADSKEAAEHKAAQMFKDEYDVASEIKFETKAENKWWLIASLLCFLISILLSFVPWYDGHTAYSIAPDGISTGLAVVFVFGFIFKHEIFRTIKKFDLNVWVLMAMTLTFASLFSIILHERTLNLIFRQISIDPAYILGAALILMFVGIKGIASLSFAFLAFVGLANIVGVNDAMGIPWGMLYIGAAYAGILIYIRCNPIMVDVIKDMFDWAKKGRERVSRDFLETRSEINRFYRENSGLGASGMDNIISEDNAKVDD